MLAKSIMRTWPVRGPGKARSELLLFGHKTHSPEKKEKKKNRSYDYCSININKSISITHYIRKTIELCDAKAAFE